MSLKQAPAGPPADDPFAIWLTALAFILSEVAPLAASVPIYT